MRGQGPSPRSEKTLFFNLHFALVNALLWVTKSKSFRIKPTNSCMGELARFSIADRTDAEMLKWDDCKYKHTSMCVLCVHKRLWMRSPPRGNTHKVRPLMQSEAQFSRKCAHTVFFFFSFLSLNTSHLREDFGPRTESAQRTLAPPFCADL